MLEEKRKKREEAKKAAEEAKRKKLAAKGAAPTAEPEEPKEETCIIDNLLKEIRAGTTLKPTGQNSVRQRRRASQLKKGDLQKLNEIVEKAATTPRKLQSPAASGESHFKFPVAAEQDENSINTVNTSNSAEIQTSDQQAVENAGERLNGDNASVQTKTSHSEISDAYVSPKGSPSIESRASTRRDEDIPAVSEDNHVAVANGESGSHFKGETKSDKHVLPTKAESNAQSKVKAKSVPVEDACVPETNGESNTRLKVEAKSVLNEDNRIPVANGRSSTKLKAGEDRRVPVANGKSNTRLRVQTKSIKTGARDGSGSVPPKTQSERLTTTPLVGDTAAKSPSLPTHHANDHFPHEKDTPICKTIKGSDRDVGGSQEEDRDRMSQSRNSSDTSLPLMVSLMRMVLQNQIGALTSK